MITLIGYMGSGKSTIGRTLAEKLNYQFIDLDDLIEDKMESSITTLFEKHGEDGFRTIEINLLQYAIMKGEQKAVISTGGGTPTRHGVMEYINQVSTSFFLNVSSNELVKRLSSTKADRPLIADKQGSNLNQFINDHLISRLSFYQKAHHTIENKSITQSIQEILSLYSKR